MFHLYLALKTVLLILIYNSLFIFSRTSDIKFLPHVKYFFWIHSNLFHYVNAIMVVSLTSSTSMTQWQHSTYHWFLFWCFIGASIKLLVNGSTNAKLTRLPNEKRIRNHKHRLESDFLRRSSDSREKYPRKNLNRPYFPKL